MEAEGFPITKSSPAPEIGPGIGPEIGRMNSPGISPQIGAQIGAQMESRESAVGATRSSARELQGRARALRESPG